MIETEGRSPWKQVATRLATRAARLAEARAEEVFRAQRGDSSNWRNPRLLWPLFTKD